MTRFLFILMLALAVPAFAQPNNPSATNPCGVQNPMSIRLYADQFDGVTKRPPAFNCMPEMAGGRGKGLTIKVNTYGVMAWWYCPDGDQPLTEYRPNWGAATWEAIQAGQLQPDMNLNDTRLTPIWCPHITQMYGSVPVVPTASTLWLVAAAAAGSRPLYSVVNGELVAAPGRATVGTACDCAAAKLVKGTSTYCAPAGQAPLVALCTAKAP